MNKDPTKLHSADAPADAFGGRPAPKSEALAEDMERLDYYQSRKAGVLSGPMKAILEILVQAPHLGARALFQRLEKDERFARVDAETVRFKATGFIVSIGSLPGILSRLRERI